MTKLYSLANFHMHFIRMCAYAGNQRSPFRRVGGVCGFVLGLRGNLLMYLFDYAGGSSQVQAAKHGTEFGLANLDVCYRLCNELLSEQYGEILAHLIMLLGCTAYHVHVWSTSIAAADVAMNSLPVHWNTDIVQP